jgi:hypothetical protein
MQALRLTAAPTTLPKIVSLYLVCFRLGLNESPRQAARHCWNGKYGRLMRAYCIIHVQKEI